jgi:hypothetical protein
MASPTPHRFNSPRWYLADVFGWLLDRDPARFGSIFEAEEWLPESYGEAMAPDRQNKPLSRTVLMEALQRGDLIAYDPRGERVDPGFWLAKSEHDLPALGQVYRFHRDDVLRLWPHHPSDNQPPLTDHPAREEMSVPTTPAVGFRTSAQLPIGYRTQQDQRAEVACENWLVSTDLVPKDKDAAFLAAKAAVAAIGPLSRKAFDRAWAHAAPAAWRQPGRRPKTPPV